MNMDIEFKTITPGCCGATFAVPDDLYRAWLNNGDWWYCPACGSHRHFTGESDATKFKRLYESKNRCCEDLKELVDLRGRQVNGSKGAMGLLRKQRDEAREQVTP